VPVTEPSTRIATGKRLPKGARGGIELLLIHNVESLGKQGDVVEVKRGFATNYLLPQGLATIATDHHKRMVEKQRAKLEEIARSLKQQDLMVSPEQIILQGPLKEVGLYTVKVRLGQDVEGDLKVWVVPSSSDAASK
jgi:large subunit ribosomal protein L9